MATIDVGGPWRDREFGLRPHKTPEGRCTAAGPSTDIQMTNTTPGPLIPLGTDGPLLIVGPHTGNIEW